MLFADGGGLMGAVWVRARAEMRVRWRALVSMTVLFGVFGAAVLATLAGAQRTQTAYPRFLERQRAYDLLVSDSTLFDPVFWKPDFAAIARLPYVETSARVVYGSLKRFDLPGKPGAEVPDLVDGPGFIGSNDPSFADINRPLVVSGRLPSPDQPNEIAIPYFADRLSDAKHKDLGSFHVGDRVKVLMRTKMVTFTIVGQTAIPGELPPRPQFGWTVTVSAAFVDRYASGCSGFQPGPHCLADFVLPSMMVRFRHRSDVGLFEKDVRKMTHGKVLAPQEQESHARAVEGSTDLQASALRLLGLFTALTGIMILGQLLARETTLGAEDAATLRALGFDRRQLFRLGVVRVVPVALGASVLAMSLAWLASPIFPRGSVRVIEPVRLSFDVRLLAIGGLIVAAAVIALVVWPAWRAATKAGDVAGVGRPSVVASALSSAGMSVPAVAGARLALERGRGRTAVPVVSSLAVVSIGIASFVAATTFSASMNTMIDRPALRGVSWNAVINTADYERLYGQSAKQNELSARTAQAIAGDPDVIALAFADSGVPTRVFGPGGPQRGISVLGMAVGNVKGSMYSPLVEGRYPVAPDEVLLGARMIRALKLHLDPVHPPVIQVALQGAGDKRVDLHVVGRAVIPPLGNFGELGYGIMFGARSKIGEALADPSQIPPVTDLIARLRPGADLKSVIARYTKRFPQVSVGDPIAGGRFADAINFGGVQGAPFAVGGVLALLGAAALAHVLVTAIRRRRRDIAILKTIGFVRGQARRAVAWQATVMVVVASVAGIPVGVAGGRLLWNKVADGLGVIPQPRTAGIVLLLLPLALLFIANLIAGFPGRSAARTKPALVLRSE